LFLNILHVKACSFLSILVDNSVFWILTDNNLLIVQRLRFLVLRDIIRNLMKSGTDNIGITHIIHGPNKIRPNNVLFLLIKRC
jgi:hypothetical protein